LILPLMLAVSLAVAVSRRISRLSMVEQQMIDEGGVEEHETDEPLARITAAEAMTPEVVTIEREAKLAAAASRLAANRFAFFPVTVDGGKLAGLVSREAIEQAVRDGRLDEPVWSVLEEARLVAAAGDRVIDVIQQMQVRGVDRCPVVETHASQRLVGFLSPSDILRIRLRHASREQDGAFELFE
jgi:CBS domain-containing protein